MNKSNLLFHGYRTVLYVMHATLFGRLKSVKRSPRARYYYVIMPESNSSRHRYPGFESNKNKTAVPNNDRTKRKNIAALKLVHA